MCKDTLIQCNRTECDITGPGENCYGRQEVGRPHFWVKRNTATQAGVLGAPLFIVGSDTKRFNCNTDARNYKSGKEELPPPGFRFKLQSSSQGIKQNVWKWEPDGCSDSSTSSGYIHSFWSPPSCSPSHILHLCNGDKRNLYSWNTQMKHFSGCGCSECDKWSCFTSEFQLFQFSPTSFNLNRDLIRFTASQECLFWVMS